MTVWYILSYSNTEIHIKVTPIESPIIHIMFPARIATGRMTFISRAAILVPRTPMLVPGRGISASMPIASRKYHDGGSPKLGEESAASEAKNQTVEGANEVGGEGTKVNDANAGKYDGVVKKKKKKKTIAELDEELKAKMEGREGAAGISYEGGKPVTDGFGRGVKSNMFRVI